MMPRIIPVNTTPNTQREVLVFEQQLIERLYEGRNEEEILIRSDSWGQAERVYADHLTEETVVELLIPGKRKPPIKIGTFCCTYTPSYGLRSLESGFQEAIDPALVAKYALDPHPADLVLFQPDLVDFFDGQRAEETHTLLYSIDYKGARGVRGMSLEELENLVSRRDEILSMQKRMDLVPSPVIQPEIVQDISLSEYERLKEEFRKKHGWAP